MIIYISLSSLVVFTIVNIIFTIVYKNQRVTKFFLLFCIICFFGLVLTSLRNQISDFLSIVIGVSSFIVGCIFLYIGIKELLESDGKWLNRYFIPIGIVFLGLFLFTEVYYDLHMRIIIFSLFIVVYSMILSLIFWNNSFRKLKFINRLTSICFAFIVLIFLLRVLNASTVNNPIEFFYLIDFMVISPYFSLFFVLYILILNTYFHLRLENNK